MKGISSNSFIQLLLCTFFVLSSSCYQEPAEIVADWEENGWSKVKTHGLQKAFVRKGKLASEKAQSIEVSWIERGKRKTKLYPQSSHYYTALRFFCDDGDEFVIVMRKRK